jgi:mono/diheme cytochrome c family protein
MIKSLSLAILITAATCRADVVASYQSGSGGETFETIAPVPALQVSQGESPTPFLAPGPFAVTWRGRLSIPQRQRLFFQFDGEGSASLKIDGKVVLEESGTLGEAKSKRTRLNAGEHEVEITFQSNPDGSGRFRLLWEERSFALEPVLPTAWVLPEAGANLTMEKGRHAFASQNCAQCHTPDTPFGEGSMPELTHKGPDLTGIGSRVTEAWLTRWIAQPDKLKPTTTMPAMVDHRTAEGAQQAADLAAFLATLTGESTVEAPASTPEMVKAGGAHFHRFGCVACHTPPAVDVPDRKLNRIPLNSVASKFQPGQLSAFLKNPQAHHPSIKMPDFQLDDTEAKELAAFLRSESTGRHTPDPSEFAPGDPTRGKELVQSLNCAACHTGLPEGASTSPSLSKLKELEDWTANGCLAPEEKRGSAPRLILDRETADHIAAFAKTQLASLDRSSPAHLAHRQLEALNCRACHSNDDQASLIASLHPESQAFSIHAGVAEKVDQSRPALTYMGEMLTTSFMEKILRGEADPRPRPWLEMRMPAFPEHAHGLAHGLSKMHGLAPSEPDAAPRQAEAAKTGKMIAGIQGLACVTCHGAGEMKPLAAFEVVGINFDQTHDRLLEEYFHRWLRNPRRIQPESKMPAYTTPDGGSLRPDILEGDAEKQFDAIWEYLKAGSKVEQP